MSRLDEDLDDYDDEFDEDDEDEEDDGIPPGRVVFTGNSAYLGKECLKKLGGYWDPPNKRWLVPEANEAVARECVRHARSVGRLLSVEEAVDHIAAVREAFGIKRRAAMEARLVCFECGKSFTIQQVLERGGVPADWYCGCEEPRNKPVRRAFGFRP